MERESVCVKKIIRSSRFGTIRNTKVDSLEEALSFVVSDICENSNSFSDFVPTDVGLQTRADIVPQVCYQIIFGEVFYRYHPLFDSMYNFADAFPQEDDAEKAAWA